jgi:DNA-binding NarL/FixJ family response regulator
MRGRPPFRAEGTIFSKRELAIVRGIVSGKPAVTIATDLGISCKTVSTFKVRAANKLGVTNRGWPFVEAAKKYLEQHPAGVTAA